ncbi:MAG: DUF1289 domain-containing protein [Gammaproteobacteria bacterium]
MKPSFKPCVNRTACTEDGTHCRSCGRSHNDIARTRELVNHVTGFLLETEYDNHEEFLDYLKKKVLKKIRHTRT